MLVRKVQNYQKTRKHHWELSLALWCVGLLAASLVPALLSDIGVASLIANQIVALGFDAERTLFIETILLTLMLSLIHI